MRALQPAADGSGAADEDTTPTNLSQPPLPRSGPSDPARRGRQRHAPRSILRVGRNMSQRAAYVPGGNQYLRSGPPGDLADFDEGVALQ
eukprot:scaffold7392_cov388-Prasinococcus_capsulatus_cf.AAC.1